MTQTWGNEDEAEGGRRSYHCDYVVGDSILEGFIIVSVSTNVSFVG